MTVEEELRTIKLKREIPYTEDCERIRSIFEKHGYSVSLLEGYWLWSTYSDTFAASWLFLPEQDEDVFGVLKHHFDDDDQ